MALIPKYNMVAAIQAVDPTSLVVQMGNFVSLNGAYVRRATTGDEQLIYGVAGDTTGGTSNKPTQAYMPGVASGWQNRVSDGYDEAKASGKLTVYHSGGEFATDMHNNTNMDVTGRFLSVVCNALTTGARLQRDGAGVAFLAPTTVALLTRAAGNYPSGVPGTDTGLNGDMALTGQNSNAYIEYKLLI